MATTHSQPVPRSVARRQAVIDEALRHAVEVMTESGVGALTVSEVARRSGMRGPSLYKYFPSLHALYDALFAVGLAGESAAVTAAVARARPGVGQLEEGGRAVVRWCTENPALAQLLHWRPVPGFEPSPEVFAPSRDDAAKLRAVLAEAVRLGQLTPDADSDDAARLYTVLLSGLISQQLANQPGVDFESGAFTGLTDHALDLFLTRYRTSGGTDADPRP